ncbi:MAG: M14 family metallopeptidase [Phycisphaerales bacterium JB060]
MNIKTLLTIAALSTTPSLAQDIPAAQDGTQRYNPDYKVDIAWNRYYDYEQIVDLLKQIEAAHPELVTLKSLGKSLQGRDVWLAIANNPETGEDGTKPAMYIDGNIHGNEVQAAEVVLYSLWKLVESHGNNEPLTELLDNATFYFVPVSNPDGRAWWFAEPNTPSSSRHNQRPVDNDSDGQSDEDGYDDLDGDGSITQMWRKRTGGPFRRSETDPRRFERVGPYELGEWEYLGSEGLDNDGDGRINEDAPFADDMNRNWPGDWQPGYAQFGAGPYPFSAPETFAIGQFVLSRPNIAAGQSYHNSGGMILRGPGDESRDNLYDRSDSRVYDAIAAEGAQMLPYYRDWVIWKDLYGVHGGQVNWLAETLAIVSFTNELWTNNKRFQGEAARESEDQQWLWRDHMVFGDEFTDYTEFDHPDYGTVLIGGPNRWASRNTPPFLLEEEAHRNFAFTMYHARQMPLLRFGRVDIEQRSPGLWQVDVAIRNERHIPTRLSIARRNNIGQNDLLHFEGEGAQIITAGRLRDFNDRQMNEVRFEPSRIQLNEGVGGMDEAIFRYIIKGDQGDTFTLRYEAEKARNIERTFTLEPTSDPTPLPLGP